MKLGAHLSISKGPMAMLNEAQVLGMNAVQAFARNPRGRGETIVPEADAAVFRKALADRDVPFVIHAPYYVNVGSGKPNNQRISREVTKLDLEKGDLLGASYVVVHLGTPGEEYDIATADAHTAVTVKDILDSTEARTMLLLETSAGEKKVGSRFEQLADILTQVGQPERLGVCLDTCHLWVSGYDIRDDKMKGVIDEFERIIGLDRLKVIHLNDTQSEFARGRDAHWHIGQGQIGEGAFRELLNDARLQDKVFLMETPKDNPETGLKDADAVNLATLKRLTDVRN